MIVIVAALLGAGVGLWRARSRGGNRADMAQYAVAHAIAFALVGVFGGIALDHFVFQ